MRTILHFQTTVRQHYKKLSKIPYYLNQNEKAREENTSGISNLKFYKFHIAQSSQEKDEKIPNCRKL